eukprot:TRINITY_DN30_c0_g1_i2.p1 TRINITY_DN30_c0_g1~~TRINITY_DN30_c0_g1_i2.p1  ORF type:complete len:648 (+),score=231.09 TRINITY_DN30_c0_g1_i2:607-2550(+)
MSIQAKQYQRASAGRAAPPAKQSLGGGVSGVSSGERSGVQIPHPTPQRELCSWRDETKKKKKKKKKKRTPLELRPAPTTRALIDPTAAAKKRKKRGRMRTALALLGLAGCAAGLDKTHVKVAQECDGDWKLDYPSRIDPSPPMVNISVSSSSFKFTDNLTFTMDGSVGLPNHPLGVFKLKAGGQACGEQSGYVEAGILGRVTVYFPPCPWPANGANFIISVNVWTVLPVIPPLISTGFGAKVQLVADGKPAMCLKIDLAQPPWSGAEKSQDKCQTDSSKIYSYPPPAEFSIDRVVVNLDDAPEHRWDAIVGPRADGMRALINQFIDNLSPKINNTIVRLILAAAAKGEMKRMPADYAAEMAGIARVTGIDVGYIWIMNMMYELTGFCTSVVAQDKKGQIFHGRNLDFGIFMGADEKTHNWALTQKLRDILLDVSFMKGGKILYNATTYAGFVGLLSGGKGPNGFSITVDTRYDDTVDKGLIEWFLGKNDDCEFLTFATRKAIELDADYPAALKRLTTYKPLGPAYIIIGGSAPGQGAVVTLAFNQGAHPVDVWPLQEALGNGSFYVLETNYDRLKAPAAFDDRRFPGENCMDAMGPENLTYENLWRVMSSNPTRNALTTFTTLMSPTTGHFEAYKAFCAPGQHCAPF